MGQSGDGKQSIKLGWPNGWGNPRSPALIMTVLTKCFNASLLKVEPFCLTSSHRNACYKGKYIWGVITAKMRCGIAILLWSFRLHNNWCYVLSIWHCKFHGPFCIFLCIYTFYYVLYSAILTYDVLDFCGDVLLFLLGSVKFCKLLCNSTFYALMYVIIQDWVTFGIFVFCFASQYYDLFQLVKLYYAYVISCMALSGQKLDGQAGGMGIVLNDAAIFCHPLFKRRTMSTVMLQSETTFGTYCSIFWDRVRKWWLRHPGSRAISTRLSI